MKDLKFYMQIPAEPDEVYRALTIPLSIQLWTGSPAIMSEEPGAEFEWYDGNISGRNLSFVPNAEIVQEWYFGEQKEPSLVVFRMHPNKRFTSLEIKHTNIPDEVFDEFRQGWQNIFLRDLLEFFED